MRTLRIQRLLLYDLAEYMEACQKIVRGFVTRGSTPKKDPRVRAYEAAVQTYRHRVAHLANLLKHQQGRLRSIIIDDSAAHIPGYFVETGYDAETAGPDREAHGGGSFAVSFIRDVRFHFVHIFLVADAVEDAIRSFCPDIPEVAMVCHEGLEKRIEKLGAAIAALPDLSFPDEVGEPFPLVLFRRDPDGVPDLGLTYGVPRLRSATIWYFKATTIFSGDGIVRSYQLPYMGARQERKLKDVFEKVMERYRVDPTYFQGRGGFDR